MVTGKITFIQTYDYKVEGATEEECFDKAYQLFKNRPAARTTYDEVEVEYEGEEENDCETD